VLFGKLGISTQVNGGRTNLSIPSAEIKPLVSRNLWVQGPSERSDGCNSNSDKDESGAHAERSAPEVRGAEIARFRCCRIPGRYAWFSEPCLACGPRCQPPACSLFCL